MKSSVLTRVPAIDMFGHFSEEELDFFESKLKSIRLKKGSYLLQEGSICQSFYYLKKGSCKHYYIDGDGIEKIMNLYVENDWMTDNRTFISQTLAKANIQTFEDCEILELDVWSIHELISKSQSFFRLGKLLGEMPHVLMGDMKTPDEKYRHLLTSKPSLIRKFPLKYLASYLGITPETLSRIRRRLQS